MMPDSPRGESRRRLAIKARRMADTLKWAGYDLVRVDPGTCRVWGWRYQYFVKRVRWGEFADVPHTVWVGSREYDRGIWDARAEAWRNRILRNWAAERALAREQFIAAGGQFATLEDMLSI